MAEKEKGMLQQFKEFTGMVNEVESNFAIEDLLSDNFLQKYTQFQNFADLKAACGGELQTFESMKAIPDQIISEKTQFGTAEELFNKAVEEYVSGLFED